MKERQDKHMQGKCVQMSGTATNIHQMIQVQFHKTHRSKIIVYKSSQVIVEVKTLLTRSS